MGLFSFGEDASEAPAIFGVGGKKTSRDFPSPLYFCSHYWNRSSAVEDDIKGVRKNTSMVKYVY